MKLTKLIISFIASIIISLTACTSTNNATSNQIDRKELTQIFTQIPQTPTSTIITPNTSILNDNNPNESTKSDDNQSNEIYNTTDTCTLRSDWTQNYTVQQGDTLAVIANRANTTVKIVADGNCLENANNLTVGQILYLPNQVTVNEADIMINGLWQNSDLQVTNNQVSIGGYATGLPLGAPVRVQLLNSNNAIIAEQVMNTQDTNVGSGGSGDFYVTLQVGSVINLPNATAEGAPSILRIYGYDLQNNVLVEVTRNIFLRVN